MTFPDIDNCIMCEDIRPEQGNKLTILGFYGVAPNVDILVSRWGVPIKLLFLLTGSMGSGAFSANANILTSNGFTILSPGPYTQLNFNVMSTRVAFGFSFPAVTFNEQGRHFFQLFVNGQEKYKIDFNVHQWQSSNAR